MMPFSNARTSSFLRYLPRPNAETRRAALHACLASQFPSTLSLSSPPRNHESLTRILTRHISILPVVKGMLNVPAIVQCTVLYLHRCVNMSAKILIRSVSARQKLLWPIRPFLGL
ncbi:hypothetical protein EJ05DRAFT_250852 [Pseudovirgaria hyperparasitica]|uniref:Uncharacterized protein n=1 Tax=Pseudovirgaria hyperparasitica TaxID=470096 RepID=A0A6A6WIM8_9PEZI|nr:uncharacterized protein EJ05DRAFT_250852 [Pseudovirgaria hyperparasitica]KAF2761041.1 hypothetical protein EJ05DRAFT_250852 [Pseudovirgaria hyperparasitica]